VIEAEIERERNRSSVIHHFALVKSKNIPSYFMSKYSWVSPELRFERSRKTGKIKDHYYVLWGNSNDYLNMGILEVLTDSGKQVSSTKSIHNKFFDVIKKSENMTFKKVLKTNVKH
jgi:hypothetical protein